MLRIFSKVFFNIMNYHFLRSCELRSSKERHEKDVRISIPVSLIYLILLHEIAKILSKNQKDLFNKLFKLWLLGNGSSLINDI